MTGQRCGRLTVLGRADLDNKIARWLCACDCGGRAVVQGGHLRAGRTISCGCHRRTWAIKPDEAIGYAAAHGRVRAERGRAGEHACIDCGARAVDWSLRHDAEQVPAATVGRDDRYPYSARPADYEARCRRCHKRYDRDRPR